jgi:hypothetical protein
LLVFHVPLLSRYSANGPGKFLLHRLPHILVAANLGLAGFVLVALPLVRMSVRFCRIMPLSFYTFFTFWAITAAGALAGGFLLFVFEYWAVRHGYRAWSSITDKDCTLQTASWKRLWWWVLISYVLLLAGLVLSGRS